MKILLLDVETAPMQVYAWSLWDHHVPIERIIEPGYTLCYAARWLGSRDMLFDSVRKSGRKRMLERVHALLDEADAVCHYNGKKFDIPVLRGEFLQQGMKPPSPFKQIDLLQTMRTTGFPSKKLDYIAQRLGLGRKTKHKGMDLWKACMAGDKSAWATMERYNKQDVRLLGRLHDILLPWIKNYPNRSVFTGTNVCPSCGNSHYQQRGHAYTASAQYPRYQCSNCDKWFRGATSTRRLTGFREAA